MNDEPSESERVVKINTLRYERRHGKKPNANKKGSWHFYVPRAYGKQPWLFIDMSYSKAKKRLEEKATVGGEFILAP